jgi:phospholipase D1/2
MTPVVRTWATGVLVVALLIALAAAWKWTDLATWADPDRITAMFEPLRSRWYGLFVVVAVFVVAEMVLFPVLVLVLVCGLAFGPVLGPVYALAGALASALPPFWLGRKLGRARVERIGGRLAKRVAASLERRGVIAVFLVRKVPAPYSLANLVCGASPVSLRDFVIGTLLGMGTGVLLLTVVGARIPELLSDPTAGAVIGTIALLFAPLVVAMFIQRSLNRRAEKAS